MSGITFSLCIYLHMDRSAELRKSCLISSPSESAWCPKDATRALTSPNEVYHLVKLSNTKFITYIYTLLCHFFSEIKPLFEYFLNVSSNLLFSHMN